MKECDDNEMPTKHHKHGVYHSMPMSETAPEQEDEQMESGPEEDKD